MNRHVISARALAIFDTNLLKVRVNTDRVFLWLLLVQWAVAITLALTISPYAWAGNSRSVHLHLEIAVIGGVVLNSLPLTLMYMRPGSAATRHVVAATQMLWAAIFVHLTGGRIETHFHIFGSLAFLAFYRDPRVLATATLVVALDHLLLGFFWPESVYGIANPEWWRFVEHAAWVVFEVVVLWLGCLRALEEMSVLSDREATLEVAMQNVEAQVSTRTRELKDTAERYRTLIENTSAVPWELARDTLNIVYAAPQLTTVFGLGLVNTDLPGNFLDLFHPDDREPLRQFLCEPRQVSAAAYFDARMIAGERIMYARSFVAEQEGDAASNRVRGLSIDVTQQRKMEQELVQAQKLESIGRLSAGIAHEINTPAQYIGDNIHFVQDSVVQILSMMTALVPLSQRLGESTISAAEIDAILSGADVIYLQDEVPKAISQALEGVGRISKIVGAMQEFSHPAIDLMPYNINHAIASTITVASNQWKYIAEVKTDYDPDLPFVSVMPGAFNQVILNMLVNAAHAIETVADKHADTRGLITITTRKVDKWCEIRIQDTGCGIPAGVRAQIFDPFFTTKPVGKGTGQGLAIAHDVIVNKHKGTIGIEGEEGAGTTFVIRVPIIADRAGVAGVAA